MNKELLKDISELFINDLEEMDIHGFDLKSRIEAELAKPDPEPVGYAILTPQGRLQTAQRYKNMCEEMVTDSESIVAIYTEPPVPKGLQGLSESEIYRLGTGEKEHTFEFAEATIKAFCEKNGLKLDAPEK